MANYEPYGDDRFGIVAYLSSKEKALDARYHLPGSGKIYPAPHGFLTVFGLLGVTFA